MPNLIERRYPVYIETTTNAVVSLNTQFVLGDTLDYIEFFFKKGSEDIKPKGKQFMVNIERPTGTTGIFSVESILEDRVIWRLQDTATNVVGKYKASISMVDEVGRYSSFTFNYEVKQDIGGKDIGE